MSHRWRPVIFPLAIVSALAVCSAQQIFRSGVSLVLVDLRVIDKDYTSVADLQAKDVDILVDGQPRALAGFQYHGDDPRSPRWRHLRPPQAIRHFGRARVSSPDPTATEFGPESMPRPPGRTIVLAVQSNTVQPRRRPACIQRRGRIHRSLAFNDAVSVVALPAGAVTHLGFTNSRESIRRRFQSALTHTSGGEWVRAAGPTNCEAPATSIGSGSSFALTRHVATQSRQPRQASNRSSASARSGGI